MEASKKGKVFTHIFILISCIIVTVKYHHKLIKYMKYTCGKNVKHKLGVNKRRLH